MNDARSAATLARADGKLGLVGESGSGIVRVDDLDVHVRVSDQRSTVRLTVERDSAVTAVVPPRVDQDELVTLIKAKRRWLYGKLAERQALGEGRPPREYVSGEGFPYLGRSRVTTKVRIVGKPAVIWPPAAAE